MVIFKLWRRGKIFKPQKNKIPFYAKRGFDKYEKTIKNYFIDTAGEEVKDGDSRCTDMLMQGFK